MILNIHHIPRVPMYAKLVREGVAHLDGWRVNSYIGSSREQYEGSMSFRVEPNSLIWRPPG